MNVEEWRKKRKAEITDSVSVPSNEQPLVATPNLASPSATNSVNESELQENEKKLWNLEDDDDDYYEDSPSLVINKEEETIVNESMEEAAKNKVENQEDPSSSKEVTEKVTITLKDTTKEVTEAKEEEPSNKEEEEEEADPLDAYMESVAAQVQQIRRQEYQKIKEDLQQPEIKATDELFKDDEESDTEAEAKEEQDLDELLAYFSLFLFFCTLFHTL